MLAIIMAILILFVAIRNSSADDFSYHCLRFASHDILRLPGPLLLLIFPCRICCSRQYLSSFRMMCPRYSSLRHLTVLTISVFFFILLSTSLFVIFSVHDILNKTFPRRVISYLGLVSSSLSG
uniref:Vomeronasal type-1 receptor n=1 Tax=Cacopsylla melanoneura TaxID=428564 RepID=A0A8D9AUP8_9HEMI